MLINKVSAYYQSIKRQGLGLKHCDDSKAFIEYSNDMQDAYKNIEEYYTYQKRKVLWIIFDDMIWLLICLTIKNLTELLIWGRKPDISLVFITQSYFTVTKNVILNSMHSLLRQLQLTRATTVQI